MKTIYKATCTIDGSVYIGQTNNLSRRKNEHKNHADRDGGPFHEAILKHGFENFVFEELESVSDDIADEKERFYINKIRQQHDNVYNFCDGGKGGQTHDVSGSNNPMYGKTVSDEKRKHLSMCLSGRKKPDGFGAKVSAALTGRKKSEEQVAKRSDIIILRNINTGELIQFKSKAEAARCVGFYYYNAVKTVDKISNGYQFVEKV